MNTKSLLTRIGVPVLSLGLLGGLGATLATSASASTLPAAATLSASVQPSTATVVASTHVPGVPDTTVGSTATGSYEDASGNVTSDPNASVYGPVWAIDDITNTYRVTPLGNNDYAVDRMANGTFVAFAQPNTGLSTVSQLNAVNGQVHGTNSYVVHSTTGPDASKLHAEQPIATGSHTQLMQLFPGINDSDISGGGTWVFSYHAAHGSMTQRYDTDPSTWGNITG
jgi:hypothetical protein